MVFYILKLLIRINISDNSNVESNALITDLYTSNNRSFPGPHSKYSNTFLEKNAKSLCRLSSLYSKTVFPVSIANVAIRFGVDQKTFLKPFPGLTIRRYYGYSSVSRKKKNSKFVHGQGGETETKSTVFRCDRHAVSETHNFLTDRPPTNK